VRGPLSVGEIDPRVAIRSVVDLQRRGHADAGVVLRYDPAVSIYSRLPAAVGDRRWFAAVASRVAPRLDRIVFRITRGRRLTTPASVPTFFVTTVGRRTCVPRTVALSFLQREAGYIVVGTRFGKSATPEWALNLAANPRVRVEWGGEEFRAEARAVPIQDQDALWEAFEGMWSQTPRIERERPIARSACFDW